MNYHKIILVKQKVWFFQEDFRIAYGKFYILVVWENLISISVSEITYDIQWKIGAAVLVNSRKHAIKQRINYLFLQKPSFQLPFLSHWILLLRQSWLQILSEKSSLMSHLFDTMFCYSLLFLLLFFHVFELLFANLLALSALFYFFNFFVHLCYCSKHEYKWNTIRNVSNDSILKHWHQ